jgi:quercetin dioxygenase-like cupin family protein
MLSKLFWAAAFLCLTTALAQAQDPTKVEPRHYKLNFENERVQALSVHYGPHEKSVMHDHPGGVVIALTAAHLRFTDEQGKTREVYSKPGETRWYPPSEHMVENLGDTTYDAVYDGIKGGPSVSVSSADPSSAIDEQTRRIVAEYLLASQRE